MTSPPLSYFVHYHKLKGGLGSLRPRPTELKNFAKIYNIIETELGSASD